MPLAVCLLATGCASATAPTDDIRASIRKCGLSGQIRVETEGERRLHVRYLNPNADYAKVDCFIAETHRLGLDLGFVGNEGPPAN
jgi:hypothetical protein